MFNSLHRHTKLALVLTLILESFCFYGMITGGMTGVYWTIIGNAILIPIIWENLVWTRLAKEYLDF